MAAVLTSLPAFPSANDFQVLYRFQNARKNGLGPFNVAVDANGDFEGVAESGGRQEEGAVFKIQPDGSESILYSFCAQDHCADGNEPDGALIFDNSGNVYGTTFYGGTGCPDVSNGCGTVYQLSPGARETVLHSFGGGSSDGAMPKAGLLMDNKGNLYGTTSGGGNSSCGPTQNESCGTVFEIGPGGGETILYAFHGSDGGIPTGPLVTDGTNFYGTTTVGGMYNNGTVFALNFNGESYTESVLYSFCSQMNCLDGANPSSGLAIDENGYLYGTTLLGGSGAHLGTLFKINIQSATETVLYSFCRLRNCADGAYPNTPVITDSAGNIYGTTVEGGLCTYCGTVFEINQSGSETLLHKFCTSIGQVCTDGDQPRGGVVLYENILYGATPFGGSAKNCPTGCGVVFRLQPKESNDRVGRRTRMPS
jgi:uncharacterized repeat protein (TIGR03803 family)